MAIPRFRDTGTQTGDVTTIPVDPLTVRPCIAFGVDIMVLRRPPSANLRWCAETIHDRGEPVPLRLEALPFRQLWRGGVSNPEM